MIRAKDPIEGRSRIRDLMGSALFDRFNWSGGVTLAAYHPDSRRSKP